MKKVFTFVLTIICCTFSLFGLVACDTQENSPENNHIHSWKLSWSMDKTYHWKDCESCLEKDSKSTHTFDGNSCYCGYTKNDTNSNNGGSNDTNNEANSFLTINNDSTAIKQKNANNKISLIVENNREIFKFNNLFSYSNNFTLDIYALTTSSIDSVNKQATLSNGYNHFQVLFKNLLDFTETSYEVEIFKDLGVITRKINRYLISKECTRINNNNGLPQYNLKLFIQDGLGDYITLNGEDIPAKIIDCNIAVVYQASFYVDSKNYLPSTNFPHQYMESFTISHKFTNLNDMFETTITFPQDFWDNCCSKSPFLTLDNSNQGIYEKYPNEIYVYNDSYISLSIDYSKYQFI